MTRIILKTRTNGIMEFFAPAEGGAVRLESPGRSGILGQQICERGSFCGGTLSANAASLEYVARKWYRAYRAKQRKSE